MVEGFFCDPGQVRTVDPLIKSLAVHAFLRHQKSLFLTYRSNI